MSISAISGCLTYIVKSAVTDKQKLTLLSMTTTITTMTIMKTMTTMITYVILFLNFLYFYLILHTNKVIGSTEQSNAKWETYHRYNYYETLT